MIKINECCHHCKEEFPTRSGGMTRHIRTHSFNTIDEYYYSFNDEDLCEICHERNKVIINWNFEKRHTCDSKECGIAYKCKKVSEYQKKLVLENKHNYQSAELQAKVLRISKEKRLNGTHKSLTPENKEIARQNIIRRNEKYGNPMKNPAIAAKMAASSKGKILTEEHKAKISLGVSNYIGGLSNEELIERITANQIITCVHNHDDNLCGALDILHIFENSQVYEVKTKNIINVAEEYSQSISNIEELEFKNKILKHVMILTEEDLCV